MSEKEENGSRASSASRSLSPGEARSPEHKSPVGSAKERSRSRSRTSKKSGGGSRHSGPRSVSRSRSRSFHKERYRSRSRSRGRDKWRYSRSRSRSRSPYSKRRRSKHSRSRSRSRSPYFDKKRGYYRSHSRSPMSSRRRHMGDRENPKSGKCLGVFGLSLYTQERDLREIFGRYGPIDEVQIVYDHQTGRSRGFAFIYMRNTEDATEARDKAPGTEIDGRKIRVDFSITKRAHTPTPGIYLGKPTSRGYGGYGGGGGGGGGGGSSSSRRSASPYYRKGRYSRSRSRSYTPRRY